MEKNVLGNGVQPRQNFADLIRSLCICLIVVGHCQIPEIGIRLIYLFHVPAFFMLSGYFRKNRSVPAELKKCFRSLLLPYVLGVALVLAKYGIDAFRGCDVSAMVQLLQSAFLIGPVEVSANTWYQSGPIWFLVSLFFCRLIYQFLKNIAGRLVATGGIRLDIIMMILSLILGLLVAGKSSVLGLGQASIGMFFFAAGCIFRNVQECDFRWKNIVPYLCGLSFASVLFFDFMDIYTLKLPLGGLSEILSLCAIVFLMVCANVVSKRFEKLAAALAVIGKGSILLLLIHYYEFMTFDWSKLAFMGGILPLFRLAVDLAIFFILRKIPAVKRILQLA